MLPGSHISHAIANATIQFSMANFSDASAYRPLFPQFRSWFPKYRVDFENALLGSCAGDIAAYNAAYYAATEEAKGQLLTACYSTERCIMDSLSSDRAAKFQSASVILGLLPSLVLAELGPSVAELSLLSVYRPLLSLLISIAAPAIFPTRPFEYNDPTLALAGHHKLTIQPQKPWKARVLAVLETICVVGAVYNTIDISVAISHRSILSWGCTTTFIVPLWNVLPAIIHITSAVSYYIAVQSNNSTSNRIPVAITAKDQRIANKSETSPYTYYPKKLFHILAKGWKLESAICANHAERDVNASIPIPRFAMILNIIAGGMGFVYVVFGTVAFSSLCFISVADVLQWILPRYIGSAVLCRFILLIEIGGLKMKF